MSEQSQGMSGPSKGKGALSPGMSTTSPERSEPGATGRKSPAPAPIFLPPLRPRKKLMIASCMVFGVWVAALAALYAFEVYPRRHPANVVPLPVPSSEPDR